MKRFWYFSTVIIAVTAIFVITGCKESATKAPNAAPETKAVENKPAQPVSPAPAIHEANEPNAVKVDPNSVAVTVNGVAITEGELEAKMAPRLKAMGGQVPPQYQEQMKKQLRGRALEAMIIEQLLDAQVKEKGITVSDAQVNDEIAQQIKQQQMTEEDFKKALGMYGITMDELKAQARRGLAYQKLMETQFADKIKVTDEEAKKYYDQNKNEFETPEQVRASHILISTRSTDPNADPNKVKAEALAKAEEVLAKVKAGGDFAALAKEYSSCPSAQKGGDLGLFGRGQMVKPFEDAAFALEPNQVSGIVETEFGYHIIKATEHKDANTISFEAAKPKIEETLQNQKKGELAKEYINTLKAEATIVYPPGKEPVTAMPKPVELSPVISDANTSAKPADANAATEPADANAQAK
jgi:peptidyl-prolyl cis-trans isomerase C